MKYIALIFVLSFLSCSANGQIQNKKYAATLNTLLSHSVNEVSVEDFAESKDDYIILDAREKKEYVVSKIEGAKYVGFKDFDMRVVDEFDKNAKIIVYCSVGYRSEKIAEKLKEASYSVVSNLYGGIFEWKNQGHDVVGADNRITQKIHAYDKIWGIWLDKGEKVY